MQTTAPGRRSSMAKPVAFDLVKVTPPIGPAFYGIVQRAPEGTTIKVMEIQDTKLRHWTVKREWCEILNGKVIIGNGEWSIRSASPALVRTERGGTPPVRRTRQPSEASAEEGRPVLRQRPKK